MLITINGLSPNKIYRNQRNKNDLYKLVKTQIFIEKTIIFNCI